MKNFHILCVILFTLCIVGCSSGSSSTDGDGAGNGSGVGDGDGGGDGDGDGSPDFNSLDMVVEYWFAETVVAEGDDINFIAYVTNYSGEDFSGTVDITIEYANDNDFDTLYPLHEGTIDVSFDSDNEFEQSFTFPSMGEGDYWFKLTIGTHSENESVMLKVVIPTHDLIPDLGIGTPLNSIVGDEMIFFLVVENDSDTTFTGQVTFLLEYNRNEEGYQTLHEETVYDITLLTYEHYTLNYSDYSLPIGTYDMRLTITAPLDIDSTNNQDIRTNRSIMPMPISIGGIDFDPTTSIGLGSAWTSNYPYTYSGGGDFDGWTFTLQADDNFIVQGIPCIKVIETTDNGVDSPTVDVSYLADGIDGHTYIIKKNTNEYLIPQIWFHKDIYTVGTIWDEIDPSNGEVFTRENIGTNFVPEYGSATGWARTISTSTLTVGDIDASYDIDLLPICWVYRNYCLIDDTPLNGYFELVPTPYDAQVTLAIDNVNPVVGETITQTVTVLNNGPVAINELNVAFRFWRIYPTGGQALNYQYVDIVLAQGESVQFTRSESVGTAAGTIKFYVDTPSFDNDSTPLNNTTDEITVVISLPPVIIAPVGNN